MHARKRRYTLLAPVCACLAFSTPFFNGCSSSDSSPAVDKTASGLGSALDIYGGKLRVYDGNGTGGGDVTSDSVIATGEFVHVAATLGGGQATLYVNGQAAKTGPLPASGSSTIPLQIGD